MFSQGLCTHIHWSQNQNRGLRSARRDPIWRKERLLSAFLNNESLRDLESLRGYPHKRYRQPDQCPLARLHLAQEPRTTCVLWSTPHSDWYYLKTDAHFLRKFNTYSLGITPFRCTTPFSANSRRISSSDADALMGFNHCNVSEGMLPTFPSRFNSLSRDSCGFGQRCRPKGSKEKLTLMSLFPTMLPIF